MSLTRTAIDKNRVTTVVLLIVLVAGIQAFLSSPRAEDPGFIIRVALVQTIFPGASPDRVEQLVTDKIEKAVQEMPELDFVTSESKTGVSLVFVGIKAEYSDMRPIWDDLRRKVERAAGELPTAVIGPTVNDEFGDVFGTVVTLTGDGFSYSDLEEVADQVRDELLLIPEVAKVEIHGVQDKRVFVEYNNARLAELGLSPMSLRSILSARNIINPGGEVRTETEAIVLEPSGNFESVNDLKRTVVTPQGGTELIYLEDVANVYRGYIDPPETKVRIGGEPGLALAISLREGGNISVLGEAVDETVARLEGAFPIGIELGMAQRQARVVNQKVDDFTSSLLQSIAIVMAVMLVSLGLRTGLVVASLIPMAIVASFLVMSFFGIGLDQMSLASLIIALGMLVDNAIVMSESIMVQMSEGKAPIEAAVESAAELRIPLLTSSLTTAAAFLPIFLAESAVGEYTAPLFKVVTITLLCSWVLALTLIPLLCVRFLRVEPKGDSASFDSTFYRFYRGALHTVLRRPLLTLAGVAVAFFLGLRLFALVPQIFFPPNDRQTLTIELRMPTGAPLSLTDDVTRRTEEFIRSELLVTPEELAEGTEGITDWMTFLGVGAPRFVLGFEPEQNSPEYAVIVANTSTRAYVDEAVLRLVEFTGEIPGLEAQIAALGNGPAVSNPIEVRITARSEDQVFALGDLVQAKLESLSGVRNVRDNWGARTKKLRVEIDPARARRAGISNEDVAISLQTVLSGFTTTEYREGDDVIPVTLRSVGADRTNLSKLESLNVSSQVSGAAVPLKQIADLEMVWQPAKILRRDRLKALTVEAGLASGVTAAEVNAELEPWLREISADWPLGSSWELGGEDEASAEGNQSIAEKLPIVGLIIIVLLVAQFNSIRKPAIILITIPLGVIGVAVGLVVMRSYFGFMTLLGIISLAGVVINNAIVLLDRIRIEIEDNGLEPAAAIIESAQRRLRPIVLTTCTTIGGLIPLYLGGGMFDTMAVAMIFGLLFATVLTLGVVPVLYSLFYRVKFEASTS